MLNQNNNISLNINDLDVNKLKELQLKLLKELIRICEKYELRYYLAWGTLLGAIRHKGFIPWDDDIDVYMPYKDMIKLEEISYELGEEFFFQSHNTDPEYGAWINRLRLNNTTQKEIQFKDKDIHHGIFIDIYPLYGVAPTKIKRLIQIKNAMFSGLFLWKEPVKNHGLILKLGSSLLLKLIPNKLYEKIYQRNIQKLAKYDFDDSKYVFSITATPKSLKTYFSKELFGKGQSIPFEDIKAKVPDGFDAVLKILFNDYMKLPPENERKFHHNFIEFNLEKGVSKKNHKEK